MQVLARCLVLRQLHHFHRLHSELYHLTCRLGEEVARCRNDCRMLHRTYQCIGKVEVDSWVEVKEVVPWLQELERVQILGQLELELCSVTSFNHQACTGP